MRTLIAADGVRIASVSSTRRETSYFGSIARQLPVPIGSDVADPIANGSHKSGGPRESESRDAHADGRERNRHPETVSCHLSLLPDKTTTSGAVLTAPGLHPGSSTMIGCPDRSVAALLIASTA